MSKQVLFVSHDAQRHGAQLFLLRFIRWFKQNSAIPFQILLKTDGDLRSDFEELAPVSVWDENIPLSQWVEVYQRANIGLVYSNTFTNGELLSGLSGLQCPVLTHVHEMEYWILNLAGAANNRLVLKHTTHYIAVSQAVRRFLINGLNISQSMIDLVYAFIPAFEYQPDSLRAKYSQFKIRKQLNIPSDANIVGCVGTTDWHKGPDLFIQLALAVKKHRPATPTHFLWVGGENSGPGWVTLEHDIKKAGLENVVHFVGSHPNPLDYLSLFDVFALTSRVDSFPLVNLEAASLGKPLLCFDKSGGAQEFVERDCGYIVPYLDIDEMASRVVDLLGSSALRAQYGERARQKVRERHDISVSGPKILQVIERQLAKAAD